MLNSPITNSSKGPTLPKTPPKDISTEATLYDAAVNSFS